MGVIGNLSMTKTFRETERHVERNRKSFRKRYS